MQQETEIGRELFGYRKDDVDVLLAELYRNMHIVKEENEKLVSELADAVDKLSGFEDFSSTLKEIMTSAERTAAELIQQARDEADVILTKANREADAIIGSARAEHDLKEKVQTLVESYLSLTAAYTDKLIRENLQGLADIQGVRAIWLSNREGKIVSALDNCEVNVEGMTSVLAALNDTAGHLATKLGDETARLLFIEFERTVLILNPILDDITLGVITSADAPFGEIFRVLNKNIPNLKKRLTYNLS